jgi:hypothetical protein
MYGLLCSSAPEQAKHLQKQHAAKGETRMTTFRDMVYSVGIPILPPSA